MLKFIYLFSIRYKVPTKIMHEKLQIFEYFYFLMEIFESLFGIDILNFKIFYCEFVVQDQVLYKHIFFK